MQSSLSTLIKVLNRLQNEQTNGRNDETFALDDLGNSHSWDQFATQVSHWQAFWSNKSERSWAIYFKNTQTFLAALLSGWLAGKHLVLPSDSLPRTINLLKTDVAGFIGDFDHVDALSLATTPCLNSKILINHELLAKAQTVFLTSGSTGLPKKIIKSLEQLCLETGELTRTFGDLGSQSKTALSLATVSHQHFYGFIFRALLPLLEQRRIATFTAQYQEELIRFAANYRNDIILISSPAFLNRLMERDDWGVLVEHLLAIFSAGGVLSNAHHQIIKDLWSIYPHEIYGSTEHGVTAYRHVIDTKGIFKALASVVIKKTSDGLLALQSPYMDLTDTDDGWAMTADKINIHDQLDGKTFELCGRADRIIKIEEKRISLTDMESTLTEQPLVSKAYLLPVQSEHGSSRTLLGAVIVLSQQGLDLLASKGRLAVIAILKKHIQLGFERLSTPRRWRFLCEQPINPQGKVEFQILSDILNSTSDVVLPVFTCIEKEHNRVSLKLHIPVDLLYFKGHFSQQPIVPGVVLVDWVAHFTNHYFSISSDFKDIRKLKFHQIIEPNDIVFLDIEFQSNKHAAGFTFYKDDSKPVTLASGALTWDNIGQHHE